MCTHTHAFTLLDINCYTILLSIIHNDKKDQTWLYIVSEKEWEWEQERKRRNDSGFHMDIHFKR